MIKCAQSWCEPPFRCKVLCNGLVRTVAVAHTIDVGCDHGSVALVQSSGDAVQRCTCNGFGNMSPPPPPAA